MTLKSRKRASKRPTRKTATKTASSSRVKAKGKISVRRVHDTAVLKREPPAPNTSAFKAPARVPGSTREARRPAHGRRLVTKLIPRPEPPPTADVAKDGQGARAAR